MHGGQVVDVGSHLDLQGRNDQYSELIKTTIENQNSSPRLEMESTASDQTEDSLSTKQYDFTEDFEIFVT